MSQSLKQSWKHRSTDGNPGTSPAVRIMFFDLFPLR